MGAPKKADWREERRKQAWKLKEEGWQQKDIATALGVSEGAVSRLSSNEGEKEGWRPSKHIRGISDEEAPWLGLATIVQNGVRRAEHTLGEAVVIIGLGLLGQLVVQYVRLLGARQVIAVDIAERRLAMVREHGATVILLMGAQEAREHILKLTEGAGADVVYDVTGAAPVFSIALTLLRRFGRLVLLGDTGTPSEQRLTGDVVTKALTIVGGHDSNPPLISTDYVYWSKQRMVELFFTYLLRGDMRVSDLVTHRFSPLDAAEAYRVLREERMTALGVLFDWTRL